jgi:type II secretion system protein H
MDSVRHQAAAWPSAGFTLIELLAVVLILGLFAALVAPNVGFGSSRALRAEAEQLADALEFARQHAVMTGRSHRMLLDLEWGTYRIEWLAPEEPPGTDASVGVAASPGSGLLSLSPPPSALSEFEPVPGGFGREKSLQESVELVAVELQSTTVKRGSLVIGFEPDGMADPARIWLADRDGDENQVLELRPLADAVVVFDAEG